MVTRGRDPLRPGRRPHHRRRRARGALGLEPLRPAVERPGRGRAPELRRAVRHLPRRPPRRDPGPLPSGPGRQVLPPGHLLPPEPRPPGDGHGDGRGLRGDGRRRRERGRLHPRPPAPRRDRRSRPLDLRAGPVPRRRHADARPVPGGPRRRIGPGLHRGPQARPPGPPARTVRSRRRSSPSRSRTSPSLDEKALATLAAYAARLEEHYGSPQDIEWARRPERAAILLLQTRPLRVLRPAACTDALDVSGLSELRTGGTTVCCGAGTGPVCQVRGPGDLDRVADGAVVVSARPFPGLVTVMGKASAIVTEVGGVASHMATLAREYRVPTLAGIDEATAIPEGDRVTVDATGGSIFAGEHPELAEARRPEHELFEDTAIFELLERVLATGRPPQSPPPRRPGVPPRRVPHAARHHALRPPEGDGGDVLRGHEGRPPPRLRPPARRRPSPSRSA